MKSKLIKILSLCVVVALVFSFAACSGSGKSKKDDSKSKEPQIKSDAADSAASTVVTSDAAIDSAALSDATATKSSKEPVPAEEVTQAPETDAPKAEEPKTEEAKTEPQDQAPKAETENPQPSEEVKPKYSDAEIYEKNGKKYAKTEDGDEVEISGDNVQKLMEDYQKVQGTGSAEEKEILDRIQVILDNADKIQK